MTKVVRYLVVTSMWLLIPNFDEVLGHGMVLEPVNRASMWRNGYPTPINYDDNGNYCGGYMRQWQENGGKCGLCGDNYAMPQPRPNENTGTYGNGIVVATYDRESWVNLSVLITANHGGYFKFNICPLDDDPNAIETEECFEKFPLVLADGSYSYALATPTIGLYDMTVKLPDSLVCERCVLRWHWTTGNNWGICDEGKDQLEKKGALGCGPQETFRTCSDISIE